MPRPAWRQNQGRSAASRGYGAQWAALVRLVKRGEPRCRLCGAPTTQVDHIKPKAKGGTDDRANLQGLCDDCHRMKTGHESHGQPRRRPAEHHPGLVRE